MHTPFVAATIVAGLCTSFHLWAIHGKTEIGQTRQAERGGSSWREGNEGLSHSGHFNAKREPSRVGSNRTPQFVPMSVGPDDFDAPVQELLGLVVPASHIWIRSQVDGVLLPHSMAAGSRVLIGQTVARINDDQLQSEVRGLEAKVAATRFGLMAAESDERLQLVRLRNVESNRQLQAATATEVEAARIQLSIIQARTSAIRCEIQEARAQLNFAMAKGTKHRLLSPIAGEIIEWHRVPGEFVRAGEIVLRVESLEKLVLVNLPTVHFPVEARVRFSLKVDGKRLDLPIHHRCHALNPDGTRELLLSLPISSGVAVGQYVTVEIEP